MTSKKKAGRPTTLVDKERIRQQIEFLNSQPTREKKESPWNSSDWKIGKTPKKIPLLENASKKKASRKGNVTKEKNTKWLHRFPSWFRLSVINAYRQGLVKGCLESRECLPSTCLRLLQDDKRFENLLDHCGGEDEAFVCEPYMRQSDIEVPASELAKILGCSWKIIQGGNTWHETTNRVEFRKV